MDNFCYFCMYLGGTRWNHLAEAIPMSTHKIGFGAKIIKIISFFFFFFFCSCCLWYECIPEPACSSKQTVSGFYSLLFWVTRSHILYEQTECPDQTAQLCRLVYVWCIINLLSDNYKCSRHFDFVFFWENRAWHFIWIVWLADNSHEMSSPIFSEKYKIKMIRMLSATMLLIALSLKIPFFSWLGIIVPVCWNKVKVTFFLIIHTVKW